MCQYRQSTANRLRLSNRHQPGAVIPSQKRGDHSALAVEGLGVA